MDEGKEIKMDSSFRYFNSFNNISDSHRSRLDKILYVDNKNYLHNLNGIAWRFLDVSLYYIHGKEFEREEWEIEANRLKMLNSLED